MRALTRAALASSPPQTQALKNLGLDITRATLEEGDEKLGKVGRNKFYITDAKARPRRRPSPSAPLSRPPQTSDKIVLSERLEEIRSTIIQNMLTYHPESREVLAAGRRAGAVAEPTLGARTVAAIPTTIELKADKTGSRSALHLVTTDRPGLLVDVVRVLKDCSLNVISANINTVGLAAEDTFYVSYKGKALNPSMEQLITNALQYYLTMAEIGMEESY